jgi:predicted nucleic acid-binding protein
MPGLYVDTSSLGRVLLAEPDAPAIRVVLGSYDEWWSSALLTIELRRLARRAGIEPAANRILATIQLTPIGSAAIERASRLDPLDLRALDAIHLDAAIELHRAGTITAALTHDRRLIGAAADHGLPVATPARKPGTFALKYWSSHTRNDVDRSGQRLNRSSRRGYRSVCGKGSLNEAAARATERQCWRREPGWAPGLEVGGSCPVGPTAGRRCARVAYPLSCLCAATNS